MEKKYRIFAKFGKMSELSELFDSVIKSDQLDDKIEQLFGIKFLDINGEVAIISDEIKFSAFVLNYSNEIIEITPINE